MRLLLRYEALAVVFSLVACSVVGAQAPAPPLLRVNLEAQPAVLHPFECVELRLTIANDGSEAVRFDPRLFDRDVAGRYLRLIDADGKSADHLQVQPRAAVVEEESAAASSVVLAAHEERVFTLLAGFDFVARQPLFEKVGDYQLSLAVDGVASNVVAITCAAAPANEAAAVTLLDGLREKKLLGALYDPYCLDLAPYRPAAQDLTQIAWSLGSVRYAGLARLTLAAHAVWQTTGATGRARWRELLKEADEWLAPIPPNFPLAAYVAQCRDQVRAQRDALSEQSK